MLSRIRIGTKIAAIVLAVSLVGVSASIYAKGILRSADDAYSVMIENQDKATLFLARLNRNVNVLGYGVYRTIARDSGGIPEGVKSVKDAIAAGRANLVEIVPRLPEKASAVADIQTSFETLAAAASAALARAEVNDDASALAGMAAVDDDITGLSKKITAFNDTILAAVDQKSTELTDLSYSASYKLVGGTVISAVLGLIAALWISAKGITAPLDRLRGRMEELAGGRLDVDIDGQERGDEVGAMAKAVQIFKDNGLRTRALETEAAAAQQAQTAQRDRQSAIDSAKAEDLKVFVHHVEAGFDALSAGDLTVRMQDAVAPEFEPIRAKFNTSVESLEGTVGSVVSAVGTMRTGLNEITVAAGDLSQRTEQQAASLEETVAALAEVTRGINGTASEAMKAQGTASTALKNAEKGGTVVGQAVEAMSQIEQSSDKIGKIIGVIDEIAFQTNLLALNAGVEAARAGEAGRGFAVVAQEVRGLAQRSAEAAKEIKGLIATSSAQVGHGVALVTASGKSLAEIVAQVAEMSEVVTGIAKSSSEQSLSLKEVATAADQMDKVTQQNAAMVEETTAAAQTLLGETDDLASLIQRFRTSRSQMPSPAARAAPSRKPKAPAHRPVAQMRTTGTGGAALKAVPAAEGWSEF